MPRTRTLYPAELREQIIALTRMGRRNATTAPVIGMVGEPERFVMRYHHLGQSMQRGCRPLPTDGHLDL